MQIILFQKIESKSLQNGYILKVIFNIFENSISIRKQDSENISIADFEYNRYVIDPLDFGYILGFLIHTNNYFLHCIFKMPEHNVKLCFKVIIK